MRWSVNSLYSQDKDLAALETVAKQNRVGIWFCSNYFRVKLSHSTGLILLVWVSSGVRRIK